MQISRHWRLNAQRYRLEGVRYTNGAVSLQERPSSIQNEDVQEQTYEKQVQGTENIRLQKVAS